MTFDMTLNNPRDPRYSVDDVENRRRQAFVAILLEQRIHLHVLLEQNPESISAISMANQLLGHLQDECLNAATGREINVSRWWTLQQGTCASMIKYLKLKAEALAILKDMFESLTRLGLVIEHEQRSS